MITSKFKILMLKYVQMFTYNINESGVLYNTSAKTVGLILHKTGWSKS